MDKLPFRQVHLDFHTSECMENVGSEFSEENFSEALRIGHINSITLFSKCHHGWSYHPTEVNKMHPNLKTDLLGRQLAVCEKLGVRAQIYISAGVDERKANLYPQFRISLQGWANTLLGSFFHEVCINNDEYLSMLCAEVREVMERYKGHFDGLFLDICWPKPCVCASCIKTMLEAGLDPENPEDVKKHQKIVYLKFTQRINAVVAEYDPELPVFYNCGNIPRNDRSIVYSNTKHLELESLPTGGWGYDHFPMSAAYARVLGREFSGMTGKFHKTWGEFGGYKHPDALIYETSLSLANGAKCCIGDQLHPLGKFDTATYRLIGKAYESVEKKEKWCCNVKPVADIGIYSAYTDAEQKNCPDTGANRIMLEGKYLYNIIDGECDFNDYKLIVFPDTIKFDDKLSSKTINYIKSNGKILLSGKSGIIYDKKFFTDAGMEYAGESKFDNSYLVPSYDIYPNGKAAYLMYSRGYNISLSKDADILAYMQNSYFNRSFRHFCSHGNTPNNPDSCQPGAVISGNVGYIAWDIFTEYGENGAYHHKRIVCDMIDKMLGDKKTLTTNLQSNGTVTLMYQPLENRYINHLLYAVTKLRGDTEVIEDAVKISDTHVKIRMDKAPARVYKAPENIDITYEYKDGILSYTVDEFTLHTMIVIE